jgi:hypothetical protein
MSRSIRTALLPTLRQAFALTLVAGSLVACDREPQSAKTLREQSDKLEVLGTGGSAGPAKAQANTFKETTTKLAGLGDGKVAAAGMTLVSGAHTGLADEQIAALEEKERAATAKLNEVQAALAVYAGVSSVAAVAESYDPTGDLSDASKAKAEREKSAEDARARLAVIERQIAELRAAVKAKNDAADAKMLEFNEAMARTTSMTATQALPIVQAAHKAKREADALKLEAGKVEAQLDVTIPLANELRLLVEQSVNQAKSLDDRAAELNAKKSNSVRLAATAREEASKAKDEIRKLVGELESLRSGEVQSAGESALNTLSQAVKAAQAAGTEVPGGSKLALGTAKQKVGDVHATRARGYQAYAALLTDLAKAEPKLPDAGDYATRAQAAKAAADEAIQAARAAYAEAGSAFNGVQVTGEVKQRLQALGARLQAMSKSAEEQAADAAAAAAAQAQADAAAATPAGETPAVPSASVDPKILATLDAYFAAMKAEKWEDMLALVHASSPQSKENIKAALGMMGAFSKLEAAAKAKFGTGFAGAAAMAGPGAGMDLEKIKALTSKDMIVTVEGESASASNEAIPTPMKLKKVEGNWLIDMPEVDNPMIAQMAPMMTKALEEVAADITAGKITDMQAAQMALQQKIMGGMRPPGGG